MGNGYGKSEIEELRRLQRENQLLKEGMKQSERMQRLWQEALDELRLAKAQLKAQNHHLASLYQASSVLAHTTEEEALLDHIMDVMEQLLGLPEPRPMGIFLIGEDGSMHLAAQRMGDEEFCKAHEQMRVGDCLCGRAALGEVIVTRDCCGDPRHTLPYTYSKPHGHLILPLKAKDKVVGVFYYYLPSDFEIEKDLLDTFIAIASQLGLALENARLYTEIVDLTIHDALTGLGNRRYLRKILERDLYIAERYQGPLSLLLIDIDFFKQYNDTYGHLEGDRLLAQIGAILRDAVRSGDLPVRYGGEEFVVLLSQTDCKSAAHAAERIRVAIEQESPVTVSIGMATISSRCSDPDTLIEKADQALYRAKQAGRNRVEVCEPTR
jgi:diguanylate cyclase (GGDEF)-like protein